MDERENAATPTHPDGYKIAREKYWGERSIEEKLEYLRETLRVTHYRAMRAEQNLGELKAKFEQHAHMPNGEVGVPARDINPFGAPAGYGSEYDPLK